MAATVAHQSQPDEHSYDAAIADFRRDLSMSPRRSANGLATVPLQSNDIDEEVKVSKKRKPVAKLDAERLLSTRGVPELRRRVDKRLKFKGKGHEYSDMAQLLSLYQMWLDDLYPRAKFRDGLALIEKIGHTKRLQVMRKVWMQDTRPTQTVEEEEEMQNHNQEEAEHASNGDVHAEREASQQRSQPAQGAHDTGGDEDEMDDLDALLAEEANTTATITRGRDVEDRDDRFADEEAAMADMEEFW